MFSLTIAFGETPAMWRLLFKTQESAEKAWKNLGLPDEVGLPDMATLIVDDFGQSCAVKSAKIHGVMLEDLDQSKLAGVEMMLHNARTQAQAQTQARQEPALRAAGGGGPSVFVPQGNGRLS